MCPGPCPRRSRPARPSRAPRPAPLTWTTHLPHGERAGRRRRAARPPDRAGPEGAAVTREHAAVRPLGFFERLRGHGDLVQWRFGPNPCVFVADPECIGELLTETERSFDQPALGIAFRTVMGNGVVVARGTEWRRKRSLVQPSVRPKQVRSYAATMAGSTVELADSWSGGERVDIGAASGPRTATSGGSRSRRSSVRSGGTRRRATRSRSTRGSPSAAARGSAWGRGSRWSRRC